MIAARNGNFPPIADIGGGSKLERMTLSSGATAAVLLALSSASLAGPGDTSKDDFGGAVPLNKKAWITVNDYPVRAGLWHQGGQVAVSFAIGTDGRISNCQVIQSTGFPLLDDLPCPLLTKRARFAPAKDGTGASVVTHGSASVHFVTGH